VKRYGKQTNEKIKVTPDSELRKLVDEARRHPVLLEKDGAVYSRTPHSSDPDDLWAGYDPEKVKQAIRTYAGSWKDYDPQKVRQGLQQSAGALAGVDRDALKMDIKQQRQQESHGRPA
jgi:hypothetical protein